MTQQIGLINSNGTMADNDEADLVLNPTESRRIKRETNIARGRVKRSLHNLRIKIRKTPVDHVNGLAQLRTREAELISLL